jgi:hypothetical protein
LTDRESSEKLQFKNIKLAFRKYEAQKLVLWDVFITCNDLPFPINVGFSELASFSEASLAPNSSRQ